MVENLIEDWPATFPRPSRIALYLPADEVELWKIWATSRFADLEVVVHGTQHFSRSSSKNAADLAIATHAIFDLVLRRITHVAIFSDDSDFMSVFVAIRDEPAVFHTLLSSCREWSVWQGALDGYPDHLPVTPSQDDIVSFPTVVHLALPHARKPLFT